MIKTIALVWILCSSMACQAENFSISCKCNINLDASGSENGTICFEDVCKELRNDELDRIIQSKMDDIDFDVNFEVLRSPIMGTQVRKIIPEERLTYEVTMGNPKDNPALYDVILRANLVEGLVYESSTSLGSDAPLYEPTVIQDDINHYTDEIKWWIGTLQPGEYKKVLLNTLYFTGELPKIEETKFEIKAQLWSKNIIKENSQIKEKP